MKPSLEILDQPTTLVRLQRLQVQIDAAYKQLEDIQQSDPDLTRLETGNFRSASGSLYTASRSLGRLVSRTHSLYESVHKDDIWAVRPRRRQDVSS